MESRFLYDCTINACVLDSICYERSLNQGSFRFKNQGIQLNYPQVPEGIHSSKRRASFISLARRPKEMGAQDFQNLLENMNEDKCMDRIKAHLYNIDTVCYKGRELTFLRNNTFVEIILPTFEDYDSLRDFVEKAEVKGILYPLKVSLIR